MKHLKTIVIVLLVVICACAFIGCDKGTQSATGSKKEVAFEYWNDCTALSGLKNYVKSVTDTNSADYIPVEDRIAVFDMDGTLCGELFPEYIEYLLLEYRCLDDPDYQASEDLINVATLIRESGVNYKTPDVKDFDQVHGNAQAKAFAGLTPP